jgi:hypothetical protein
MEMNRNMPIHTISDNQDNLLIFVLFRIKKFLSILFLFLVNKFISNFVYLFYFQIILIT